MVDTPSRMIDWDLAVRIGSRLAGDGPEVSAVDAAACVAELRAGADRSTPLVREFTGLVAAERTAPVLVVDRSGWIQANADGFATVIAPLVSRLQQRKGAPSPMAEAVGSRVTGVELGAMFGFLGGKVLGQFDPFHGLDPDGVAAPDDTGADQQEAVAGVPERAAAAGRLLLVAPNIVHAERELEVDPHDFRLWVCLHEETHRVQFTAVPWMRDHLHAEMANIVGSIQTDPAKLVSEISHRVADLVSGQRSSTGSGTGSGDGTGPSLIDLFSSPEQKQVIERITGVMSLLEGHADVVMDGVGPEVIPSVAEIRRKFTQRRKGVGVLDRLLRRLLGLDQKMAQYRDGAEFVRTVVDKIGMDGFNAVWAEPANLPGKAEILDPGSWVRRVHG